jgi:hypothetical protein
MPRDEQEPEGERAGTHPEDQGAGESQTGGAEDVGAPDVGPVESGGQETSPAGGRARRRRTPALRLTERDTKMLTWIGRHRMVSARQLARVIATSEERTEARLRRLEKAGYLTSEHRFRGRPRVYLATALGLGLVGLPLSVPAIDMRSYRHDLGVVDLAVDLQLGGHDFRTEREMRHAEALGERSYSLRFSASEERRAGRHWPDLVVLGADDRLWAVELELVPKRTSRLTQILTAYRWAEHIAACAYYIENAALRARIATLVGELGLQDKVAVREWGDESGHAPV